MDNAIILSGEKIMTGKRYSEVKAGDRFTETVTITDRHLSIGAELIGDFNPLHVDEAFARASRHGGRILHGVITSAIMGAPVGMFFSGTAIGYLEHNCKFSAPVRAGDVLTTTWKIVGCDDKPKHRGGVVRLEAGCVNQSGVQVAAANGAMLVGEGS